MARAARPGSIHACNSGMPCMPHRALPPSGWLQIGARQTMKSTAEKSGVGWSDNVASLEQSGGWAGGWVGGWHRSIVWPASTACVDPGPEAHVPPLLPPLPLLQ